MILQLAAVRHNTLTARHSSESLSQISTSSGNRRLGMDSFYRTGCVFQEPTITRRPSGGTTTFFVCSRIRELRLTTHCPLCHLRFPTPSSGRLSGTSTPVIENRPTCPPGGYLADRQDSRSGGPRIVADSEGWNDIFQTRSSGLMPAKRSKHP